MSDHSVPYREGVPPPSDQHILARVVDENGNEEEMLWVLPDELEKGPLRQEEVDSLVPMLRWQWRHLGELLSWVPTFEQWEIGFLRDANPSQEVSMWLSATYAYLEFTHQNPTADPSTVFEIVVGLLVGKEDQANPEDILEEIQVLMSNSPDELFDTGNFSEEGHFQTEEAHLV